MVSGEARLTGELRFYSRGFASSARTRGIAWESKDKLTERQAFPLTIAAKPQILLNS